MRWAQRAEPRAVANSVLALAGFEVRRKPSTLIRSPHELVLTPDLLAADVATRLGRELMIVQVGAHDASANDPISTILERFNCRGILVEPQTEPFRAAVAKYKDSERVVVVNVAISDVDGTRELFTVKQGPDMPTWITQVASFDRAHVERQGRHLRSSRPFCIEATLVETWTFDTLFDRCRVSQVDILQIDAEGYDYELLKMFDIPQRLPPVIHYEHGHLSRADRGAAARMLIANGYKLSMSFSAGVADTTAYRRPAGPAPRLTSTG